MKVSYKICFLKIYVLIHQIVEKIHWGTQWYPVINHLALTVHYSTKSDPSSQNNV